MSTLRTKRAAAIAISAAAVAAIATTAGTVGTASGATTPTPVGRAALADSAPPWLNRAQHVGTTSTAQAESLRLYLAPKGGLAKLQAAVAAVSTPGTSSYRKFLTPTTYYQEYSTPAASVAAVKSWLKSSGLTVTSTDGRSRFLDVTGTAKAAEAAFGVSLQTYAHDGQTVQAPSGDISLPKSIAAQILGVSGLDTTVRVAKVQAPPPAAFANGRPCSITYGQVAATYQADYKTKLPKFRGKTLPYAVCGYSGSQYRSAYEANSTLTGAGVSVGVIDAYAAPTIVKDIKTYTANHGDGSYAAGQYTQTVLSPFTNQKLCDPSGWYGEETLDIEAVHAMAPGANIHFYGGASCLNDDLLAAARQAVDDDQVQLVSNSYGDLEQNATADYIAASEQVFMQGAMEGIGFLFSSGDDGDELTASGVKQADYQTSDPYVTSVGGTTDAIDATGTFAFQTGWGTAKFSLSAKGKSWQPVGYLYGSGGGYSSLFNRPSYQNGVVPANAPAGRAVPDVAMDADPTTGMLIGETQTYPDGSTAYGEYRIGGTSLASPLFAGMTALLVQHVGGPIGFLNPRIYAQAKKATGSFRDIAGTPPDAGNVRADNANGVDATGGTIYSVRTFDQDSSLALAKGWDDVTGVGAPTKKWLTSVK